MTYRGIELNRPDGLEALPIPLLFFDDDRTENILGGRRPQGNSGLRLLLVP